MSRGHLIHAHYSSIFLRLESIPSRWTDEQTSIHSTSGENSPQERDLSKSKEDELECDVGSEVLIGLDAEAHRGDR